jgi:hypothetical protein
VSTRGTHHDHGQDRELSARIPFKSGIQSAASARGDDKELAADGLLVKVTTDEGWEVGARPSASAPCRRLNWRSTADRASLYWQGHDAERFFDARRPEEATRLRAKRAIDVRSVGGRGTSLEKPPMRRLPGF